VAERLEALGELPSDLAAAAAGQHGRGVRTAAAKRNGTGGLAAMVMVRQVRRASSAAAAVLCDSRMSPNLPRGTR
jgi:hypothetical protein